MVCLRGGSLTTHTNQMKLFNTIATSAVIATAALCTLDAVSTLRVDARPSKAECAMVNAQIEVCHKPVGMTSIEVMVMNHVTDTGLWANRNCQTGEVIWNSRLEGLKPSNYSQEDVLKITRTSCDYV